uniref:(northern house mosquito) hypothetical protein n=1 Tax=Culex pipiens TaxID=7175 RepID=A0A8D8EWG4_CULPI
MIKFSEMVDLVSALICEANLGDSRQLDARECTLSVLLFLEADGGGGFCRPEYGFGFCSRFGCNGLELTSSGPPLPHSLTSPCWGTLDGGCTGWEPLITLHSCCRLIFRAAFFSSSRSSSAHSLPLRRTT